MALPGPIREALLDLTLGDRAIAYIEADNEGRLVGRGGELDVYGLAALEVGDVVEDTVDFLSGMISVDALPLELPFMQTPSGATAHVHLFEQSGRIWILLLDATEDKARQQLVQQKVNDLSLARHRHAKILDQYLGKEVVQRLEEGIDNVQKSGERRVLTIMFADIRGFTTFSEKSLPEDVFTALNVYLSSMIPAVLSERGVLDKIIGDEIMAIFGVLDGPEIPPQQAVRAALRILVAIRNLNEVRALENEPLLNVGIGVATGPVALGVLGSRHRKSITVIGNHVNLAARLQGQAGPGQLIVDRDTFGRLEDFQAHFTEREVTLKGYRAPVGVMQLDIERVAQSRDFGDLGTFA